MIFKPIFLRFRKEDLRQHSTTLGNDFPAKEEEEKKSTWGNPSCELGVLGHVGVIPEQFCRKQKSILWGTDFFLWTALLIVQALYIRNLKYVSL